MSLNLTEILKWAIPLTLIILGIMTGIVFEKFVLPRLIKLAKNTSTPIDDYVFTSLKGIAPVLFFLTGLYAASVFGALGEKVEGLIGQILMVALIYGVAILCSRIVIILLGSLIKNIPSLPTSLSSNLARIIIFTFATLIALQNLGIEIGTVLATLGISGLAIALALQDTLANLFAGFYITISGQVRTGDYVKLETGQEGYIIDISWRNTTIREIPDNLVLIPNSKLSSSIFTNYHLPAKEITFTFKMGVGYDSDLEHVEKVTVEVAKEVMQIFCTYTSQGYPFILYENFNDFSIDFTVYMRVNEFMDQRSARHEFIKKLHCRYRDEKINIPFPIRDVYMK